MSSSRSETVEALERGLRVIEAFNEVDSELTLSEVARKTALKPATARRSLLTLEKLGHVQCIKGRYFLSARVLALGSAYLRSSNVEGLLLPTLRRLVDEFGDSAGIAVRVDTNVLYVAHYFMPGSIRQIAGTGVSYPAHLTSMGRILLADLPEDALDRWLSRSPMIRYTEFTVTDPRQFRAALKAVRANGYATVRDELFLGVTALAVPIANSSGPRRRGAEHVGLFRPIHRAPSGPGPARQPEKGLEGNLRAGDPSPDPVEFVLHRSGPIFCRCPTLPGFPTPALRSGARSPRGTPAVAGRPGNRVGEKMLDHRAVFSRKIRIGCARQNIGPGRQCMQCETGVPQALFRTGKCVVVKNRQRVFDDGAGRTQAADESDLAAAVGGQIVHQQHTHSVDCAALHLRIAAYAKRALTHIAHFQPGPVRKPGGKRNARRFRAGDGVERNAGKSPLYTRRKAR